MIAVVVLFGYLGYGFSSYYTSRSKFFKNLELLFEKLNLEINFSQSKLIEIIKNFDTHNKDVKKLSCNFIRCLEYDLEITNQAIFEGIKILNDDEKNVVCMFLKTLGKFDAFNQTKQLASQKQELNLLYKSAEEEAKKYAPLYIKLGIIAGLVVALIFA